MQLTLGVKSDPIEYRYTYDWLFALMSECGVTNVQLGSFFELYSVDDDYFRDLRALAEAKGIRIKSCFTTHRELGGFFTGNAHLEKAARRNYERYIHVASILGADFMGSNPGAVYRDQPHAKAAGIECYLKHMRELMHMARECGLRGLTVEPMSSVFEPPSLPEEIRHMLGELDSYHRGNLSSTVPVYLCGDISHGVADRNQRVLHDNWSLFEMEVPYMAEFHFKNTDAIFNSTFGFSEAEKKRGIVELGRFKTMLRDNAQRFPIPDVTGYLEIGGPKTGREYSDYRLRDAIIESLMSLKAVFEADGAPTLDIEQMAVAPVPA